MKFISSLVLLFAISSITLAEPEQGPPCKLYEIIGGQITIYVHCPIDPHAPHGYAGDVYVVYPDHWLIKEIQHHWNGKMGLGAYSIFYNAVNGFGEPIHVYSLDLENFFCKSAGKTFSIKADNPVFISTSAFGKLRGRNLTYFQPESPPKDWTKNY